MADSSVTSVPAIRLWYSQPVEISATTIRVTGEGDRAVALAAPTRARGTNTPVVATVTDSLAPGRYTVHWRTMARDGHAINGSFAFTLAASGNAAHDH